MPKHKDVYIWSSDLIGLLKEGSDNCSSDYSHEEVSEMLDADLEQDDDGEGTVYFTIVDPECWYQASWPEHVISPQYNCDATYHRVMDGEVEKIVAAYKRIHHRSIDSRKLY